MPVGKVVAKTGIKKNNKKYRYYIDAKSQVVQAPLSPSSRASKKVLAKLNLKKEYGKIYYLDAKGQAIEKDMAWKNKSHSSSRAMDGVSKRKSSTTSRRKSAAKSRR